MIQEKLGPDGCRKIAIIGSAPSSCRLGPWNDLSWSVWGVSPGAYGVIPYGRSNVWFEIHRWEPPVAGDPNNAGNRPWFSPEYCQFLREHKGPVYLAGPNPDVYNPVPEIKSGVRFPFEDYVAKYGRYFFTSSMAWMIALAIEYIVQQRKDRNVPELGEAIGLWGVDMAAHSEYAFQRPGCQHFLGLAKQLGIQIVLPPESDLMQPPSLYGISEYSPRHSKLLARQNEFDQRIAHLQNTINSNTAELAHMRGARDDIAYVLATWVDDIEEFCDITSAVSLAGVCSMRPEPTNAALSTFDEAPATPKFGEASIKMSPDAAKIVKRKKKRK